MSASFQNKSFGLITLLVVLPYLLGYPLSPQAELILLVILLVITGIPHGAIDHVIFQQENQSSGKPANIWKAFFLPYLIFIGLTFLFWLIVPVFMFWFFLAVSSYHFGQSQLYHLRLSEKSLLKKGFYIVWGIAFLSGLWLFNWQAEKEIIQTIFDWPMEVGGTLYRVVQFAAISSVVFVLIGYFLGIQRKYLSPGMALQEAGVLVILFVLVRYTSLYMAFALYFGLWHSARVMVTEYRFLSQDKSKNLSIVSFIKAFVPFSLLSFAGIAILFVLAFALKATISTFLLFLIFISALTMPHVLVMHGMYKVLEKTKGLKSVSQS